MGLFSRLLAPELAAEVAAHEQTRTERNWWRQQAEGIGEELRKAKAALEREQKRNRLREDQLTNQVLETAGRRPIAFHEEQETHSNVSTDDKLAPEVETTLRTRAREYCEQQTPDYTEADVERILDRMKENPQEWATDD